MRTINSGQLAAVISAYKGATPVTILANTDARCRKTGNPYKAVRKVNKINGFIGFDYDKSVNRQLVREDKEADFEVSERAWGGHLTSAIVEHKGKLSLCLKVEKAGKPRYYADGKLVSKSAIERFLPPYRPATNQGTDKEIVYRNYLLDNILAIRIGGETYRVKDMISMQHAATQHLSVPIR